MGRPQRRLAQELVMSPDQLASLISNRRSSLFIDPSVAIPAEHVTALATAAHWAPNHKRTWPLRLCSVTGNSRATLGESIADVMAQQGDSDAKVEKTRTKYLRAPLVIVAAFAQGASHSETIENSYAVAAGVQNLLLTAESLGYAALWSTPAKGSNDVITNFCGMDNTDTVVGLIYVGVPTREAALVERPPVRLTFRN